MPLRNPAVARLRIAGFTLIEVLIAMFLLALISLSVYNATTQTFKYREILIREGDFYNGVRLAMSILERDVEQMYSPVLMNPNYRFPGLTGGGESTADATDAMPLPPPPGAGTGTGNPERDQALNNLLNSELGQVSDFWLGATDATGIRASRFAGEEAKMTFIASSHQRLYKGSKESIFAKITYELRNDPAPDDEKQPGTRMLVRIEDPNAFDDVEKKLKWAKVYPLLTGVKSLKFRYYRRDKKAWERAFDNSKEGDRNLYPDLVEVSIEVAGGPRLNFQGTYTFRPELPYRGLPKTF